MWNRLRLQQVVQFGLVCNECFEPGQWVGVMWGPALGSELRDWVI